MAEPTSSGANQRSDLRRRLLSLALILLGVACVATAGWAYYDAWSTRAAWEASPDAQALARQAAEPTPIWVPEATPGPPNADIRPLPTAEPSVVAIGLLSPAAELAPTATIVEARAEDLELESADFRFLDPPEPGAHARLAMKVVNHGETSSGRILLGIPASWFEGYSIIGTGPAVSADRTDDTGQRTFSFPPVPSGTTATYELHVTALGEGTTPPDVKVLLANGEQVGSASQLVVSAPTPRPGPIMAVNIPRLKLKSGVIQTTWEPPPFAVGQIKTSANVTLGNSVLIGHLTGAAGNVFAHLDQLQPGDSITAVSRGVPYDFVVSRTFISSNRDASPIDPVDDARLTLMTCAGIWNPLTHDYSERLWVVAEPPDQAAVTIANAAATATAAVKQTATVVALTPTITPMPSPTPSPTPFAGEPSLPGGIGNTRANVEKAFGRPLGETPGKLVVFRQPGREVHVAFTPDPPRAALVSVVLRTPLPLDTAIREARKLFPTDTGPRADAPEGNARFVVERFTSATLEQALGAGNFSVLYTRDGQGAITSIALGLGDDLDALRQQSQQ